MGRNKFGEVIDIEKRLYEVWIFANQSLHFSTTVDLCFVVEN